VLAQRNVFAAIKRFCSENEHWNTIAAVVMPDHIHALVSPKLNRDERITRLSAAKLEPHGSGSMECSTDCYVAKNSVSRNGFTCAKIRMRAGFVDNWEEWPYFIGSDEEPNNTAA
jgi:REP element-mobilizing transposase RayT